MKQFNARKSDFAWLTRDVFGAHWQESEWEEVLLLLIAMLHDQGAPIREVVEYIQKECEVEGLAIITILKRAALSPGMVEHRPEGPHNVAFAACCLGEAGDVRDPSHGQTLLAELARAIAEYAPQTRKKEARKFVEMALKAFAVLAPQVATAATVDETINRLNQAGNAPARRGHGPNMPTRP